MLFLNKANSNQFLKTFFNSAPFTERNQANKFSRISFFIMLLSAGMLLTYTILRAKLLSFVYDESLSYLVINHIDRWWRSANNHLLNSILMTICQKLFGASEISLRLPNVFAHLQLLILSLLIVKRLKNEIMKISGFLLLNTNPFMIDFFGLARGYGLALSFMMVSIYCFIRTQETRDQYNRMFFYTLFFADLAVLSNFMILNFYLSLTAVFFLSELINNNRTSVTKWMLYLKSNGYVIILQLIFLLSLMPFLFFLKFKGEFYYGGKSDFWGDTVISLIKASLYSMENQKSYIFLVASAILILLILNTILALYLSLKYRKLTLSTQFQLLLIICILSPIAQFYLLDNPYPMERTGLFYIPLFFITIIFGLEDLSGEFPSFSKTFCIPLLLILALIFCGHLIANINLTSTYAWSFDARTKKMMEDLEKEYNYEYGLVKTGKVHIGVNWLFEPTVYYYISSRKLTWLGVAAGNEFLNKDNEFFYFFGDEINNLTKNKIRLRVVKMYFPSNTILAKHI